MTKLKSKPCDRCDKLSNIRYRIQYQQDKTWTMVCHDCWSQVSQNNPHYRYGGTWKAKKNALGNKSRTNLLKLPRALINT